MRAALLAALVACTPAGRTTFLASAATATLAADWYQTRGITADCQEANPIIGACGERFPVDVYFPLAIVLTLAVGAALGEWGDGFLGAVAGGEAATVLNNWRAE